MESSRDDITDVRTSKAALLITRAEELAVYTTGVIGYFFSVSSAQHLNAVNFLVFSALNVVYLVVAWVIWRLSRKVRQSDRRLLFGIGVIFVLTVAIGFMHVAGLELDWLLYFASVGMSLIVLPTTPGLITSVLLYAAILTTFGASGGMSEVGHNWVTILAGFTFVSAFSFSNRLLLAERNRSERLLEQVKASNQGLEEAHKQLQDYANELEELTTARERTRMAREIHDTLGHYLTILTIQLETISKLLERDPRQAAIEVVEAQRVAAQSMQEVRNAVSAMRPSGIATTDLPQAISQLGEEFRRVAPNIELVLDLETTATPPLPDLQLALYRAAQESLTNVRKHSNADKVLLRLRYENNEYNLLVLDSGSALPDKQPKSDGSSAKGFGLLGLRERIELLGGRVTAGPTPPPGQGFRVEVHVPVILPSAAKKPVDVANAVPELVAD